MTSLHYLKHEIKIKYAEKIWIFILFSKIQNKDNGKSFKQEKINCNNEDFYDGVDSSPGICLHCSLLATSCFSLTGPMTYSPSALAAAAQILSDLNLQKVWRGICNWSQKEAQERVKVKS